MCYTVVASPPGQESACNDAVCQVESGGVCVDDTCVVPVSTSSAGNDTRGEAPKQDVSTSAAVTFPMYSIPITLCLLL